MSMANLKGLRDGKASVSVKPLLAQIAKFQAVRAIVCVFNGQS